MCRRLQPKLVQTCTSPVPSVCMFSQPLIQRSKVHRGVQMECLQLTGGGRATSWAAPLLHSHQPASAAQFTSVHFHHDRLAPPALGLRCQHPPSPQIMEAQKLSTGTDHPANTGEHFGAEPGEPLEGLWEGKKITEVNNVALLICLKLLWWCRYYYQHFICA